MKKFNFVIGIERKVNDVKSDSYPSPESIPENKFDAFPKRPLEPFSIDTNAPKTILLAKFYGPRV